jgi:ribosome biogenesis GTPase / thiamine phosphate phosphatase
LTESTLLAWGLTSAVIEARTIAPFDQIGRVVAVERDRYLVQTEQGEIPAVCSGRFVYITTRPDDFPTVGDWVQLHIMNDLGVIDHVFERKSSFFRKIAGTTSERQLIGANVDVIAICMSVNEDFNPRRLERYLSAIWSSRATPLILLTKTDLTDQLELFIAQTRVVAPGVEILGISNQNDGYQELDRLLEPGRTYAFVGSSGVGKTTLVNHLRDASLLKTQAIGWSDRGRHTTTSRHLYQTPSGALVIDNPGMREFQLDDADLVTTFQDIESLSEGCRFKNCKHKLEPGCAVIAAIEQGELPMERLLSYRKMEKENAHQERKAAQHQRNIMKRK